MPGDEREITPAVAPNAALSYKLHSWRVRTQCTRFTRNNEGLVDSMAASYTVQSSRRRWRRIRAQACPLPAPAYPPQARATLFRQYCRFGARYRLLDRRMIELPRYAKCHRQIAGTTCGLHGQPLEHVSHVGVWLKAIHPGRVDQGIAAARSPVCRLPANSRFERPIAIGRIWSSDQLPASKSPSSRRRSRTRADAAAVDLPLGVADLLLDPCRDWGPREPVQAS